MEEFANSLTHGFGLILSLAGLAALIFLSWTKSGLTHFVACSIYGATLVLVYAASTLYHSAQQPRIKHYFRIFDQVSIYLLIAGTYTPFTLINLRGFWGWALLGTVWCLSLFGIIFKIIFVNRYSAVSMALYVVMGWMAIVAAKPIIETFPLRCLVLIIGGGVAYSIGLVFLAWEKLPFSHTIWHLFVLAGSFCHFFAVMIYVLPARV